MSKFQLQRQQFRIAPERGLNDADERLQELLDRNQVKATAQIIRGVVMVKAEEFADWIVAKSLFRSLDCEIRRQE